VGGRSGLIAVGGGGVWELGRVCFPAVVGGFVGGGGGPEIVGGVGFVWVVGW